MRTIEEIKVIWPLAPIELCRELMDQDANITRLKDAAEMLWVVLANVSGGDWEKQTKEWQEAAQRWRDNYFAVLKSLSPLPQAKEEKEENHE